MVLPKEEKNLLKGGFAEDDGGGITFDGIKGPRLIEEADDLVFLQMASFGTDGVVDGLPEHLLPLDAAIPVFICPSLANKPAQNGIGIGNSRNFPRQPPLKCTFDRAQKQTNVIHGSA